MTSIIGTGLSGLVGSRVTELLSDVYSFTDLSRETGVDLMDFSSVRERITVSQSKWVFHFAAYTNVQGAEDEKDQKEKSVSWQVNVEATKNITDVCQRTGKRLLYISTDYVFDGTKDFYEEGDVPDPISWYGRTKYEGERKVMELGNRALIIRIATPYRSNPVGKIDFVHKIREKLEKNLPVQAPSDQIFCPTFIDDLATALSVLVAGNASGIYHVVARDAITPYEASVAIAACYGFPAALVETSSYEEYMKGRALPPKHANLKHDKIDALGVSLHTFPEGIRIVKDQEEKKG